MDAEATVRDYYEALRRGEPLYSYFHESERTVKFGISEQLIGYEEVAEGLREQTRTTDDWRVESERLLVESRGCHAWFSDEVHMAWTDTEGDFRQEFDTRWSGTLERTDEVWLFTAMHVSTSVPTSGD